MDHFLYHPFRGPGSEMIVLLGLTHIVVVGTIQAVTVLYIYPPSSPLGQFFLCEPIKQRSL
jgi:hypothetical protein